jgi:hypothetical protein
MGVRMPASGIEGGLVVAFGRLVVAVVVALGALGGTAQAAVTGSVVDPPGDMSLDFGEVLPDPRVDFTKVLVKYDAAAGRVDVAFTFSAVPPAEYGIQAGVGIGTLDASNQCTAPEWTSNRFHESGSLTNGVAVSGYYNSYSGNGVGGQGWDPYSDPYGWFDSNSSIFDWQSGPKKEWHFGTVNTKLLGRNFNCAYAVMLAMGGGGQGLDYSSLFPLSAVPSSVGAVKWLSPANGQTVSGVYSEGTSGGRKRCEIRAPAETAKVENYVDGRLNDVQVYFPWSCEWDTTKFTNGEHNLNTVAYDVDGRQLGKDTITVRVSNPNPPASNNPPPPATEPTLHPATPSAGTNPSGPPSPGPVDQGAVLGSATQGVGVGAAKRATRRVLTRIYGKRFRKGKRYRITCRGDLSTKTCRVKWRYKRKLYKGKVKITRRRDGRLAVNASIRVRRLR